MKGIFLFLLAFVLLLPLIGSGQLVCIDAAGYPSGTKLITICPGTGISVTARRCIGTGGIFQWTRVDDPNGESFTDNPKFVTDSGTWVATDVSNPLNLLYDTIHVGFYPFKIGGLDYKKCVGQAMNLYLESPSQYSNISWYWKDFPTPRGSGPTYSFIIEGAGFVRTEARHSSGCIATAYTQIPNLIPPLIGFKKDAAICNGDSLILTSPSNKNDWYFNGLKFTAPKNYTAKVEGKYKLIAYNDIGCNSVDSINLKVNPKPEVTLGNNSTTICFNQGYKFNPTFALAGTAPYSYRWSPKATLSDSTIATPTARPSINTNYRLIVSDLNGCKDTASISVNLYPKLKAGVVFSDTTVCQFQKITLKPQSSGGTPFGGIPYLYTWLSNGAIRDSSFATPEFAPSRNTKVTLLVRDQNCRDTASVNVNISDLRVQITPKNVNLCLKDSIKLTALPGGGSPSYDITWSSQFATISNSKNLSPWVKPSLTGDIKTSVLVRDNIGCTYKDSVN
ncbi:MAG TPA: hypothetical protein VF691_20785, partial [Cytophagaceae bacterium]